MPRFAANLTMMFNEVPFLDRFDAAARAGFTAVEFLFPYDHPAEAVGERLRRNGLTQALFNLPPGNWEAGEKGFAALPENFILSVPQRSVRIPVRIAWRGDDQIGVQFVVAAASNSAPRAGDLEAEIERLRARIREMERVAREAGVEYIFNRDVA